MNKGNIWLEIKNHVEESAEFSIDFDLGMKKKRKIYSLFAKRLIIKYESTAIDSKNMENPIKIAVA